ncbi:polysaccharide biosynthesis tyrosine autokinase [Endozoicomonas gorgoniicola]|uniref:non-specific protein-tyrosine kinase n=1 Tax=Endozoicomonas gorgoniicola TaxID=1234144 RepID=A0ABT3MPW2_9GAMM|nr:polysaccharide biosynthesis tyrosine autokinase [Endozoicomonas gorgoniicola]MCW7551397.1 polysaccharide biosynthesis tyrosine autokinase [Endozoicomonas gorgoniicola]
MTTQNPYQNRLRPADEKIISIREIVGILKLYRWQITSFTASVVILAALVTFSISPTYQASARLQIEQEQAKVMSIEDVYAFEGNDAYLNTQHEVLKSRPVMEKAVKKLNLIENPEFNAALREPSPFREWLNWRNWFSIESPELSEAEQKARQLEGVIGAFSRNVTIDPVRRTQIVNIRFDSENPQMAADAANAISRAYIETWLESKLALTTNATDWMEVRLIDLSDELEEAITSLQTYREKESLIDLESELALANSELTALTQSLAQERSKLATTGTIYQQIQNTGAGSIEEYSTLPAVLAHPLIQRLKEDEARIERQAQELSRRYGPRHPRMIAAQSELNSIQDIIRQQIEKTVRGVEREYEVARANEEALRNTVDSARERVQAMNRKQHRLNELERNVQTKRDLYDAFFKRISETSATADLQTANARVVEEANAPRSPIAPNKKLIIAVAGIAALLFAAGCVFLKEMLNNTIRTSKDVEEKLNLPVLGILPVISDKAKKDSVHKLFLDKDEHGFGEAVRTIRTGLSLTALDQAHKVFAVTSTQQGEGKSSSAINTALAFATMGKTLLIDADLRRPIVAKQFNLKEKAVGLAHILAGFDKVEQCIHSWQGLDVLPTGIIPPNPQELLSSEAFASLIESLREQYDYIILDCPPVQSVSDSLMIARVCDGLIFVVEAGRLPTPAITGSIKRLMKAGAPLTGVVLNKVDPHRGTYGYEYEPYGYQGYAAG